MENDKHLVLPFNQQFQHCLASSLLCLRDPQALQMRATEGLLIARPFIAAEQLLVGEDSQKLQFSHGLFKTQHVVDHVGAKVKLFMYLSLILLWRAF